MAMDQLPRSKAAQMGQNVTEGITDTFYNRWKYTWCQLLKRVIPIVTAKKKPGIFPKPMLN